MADSDRNTALEVARRLIRDKRWADALEKLDVMRSADPDNGDPDNADLWVMSGICYINLGRDEDGSDAFQQALANDPDHITANFNWAKVLTQRGALESALIHFQKVQPYVRDPLLIGMELAKVYHRLGYISQLLRLARRLTRLAPDDPEVWMMLGLGWLGAGCSDLAIKAFQRGVELDPDSAVIRNGLALAYQSEGRVEEALHEFQRSAHLAPESVEPVVNLVSCLLGIGKKMEAESILSALRAEHPDNGAVRRLWGFHRLVSRVDREAWLAYEARTQVVTAIGNVPVPEMSGPPWRGEDIGGRTVLVVFEQGYGDAFLFGRFLNVLKHRGATVIISAPADLQRLFEGQDFVDRVHVRDRDHGTYPEYDYWTLLGSLPLYLNWREGDLARDQGCLQADEALSKHWAARFQELHRDHPDMPRIGVVWAGYAGHFRDRYRSLAAAQFAPILSVGDVQFVSLQPGLASSLIPEHCIDLGPNLDDFATTAAIVANLDLVVTIDSAVANLAAAMGRPAWVLLDVGADWRWGDQPERTAWYHSARLFRQSKPWDWDGVVEQVCVALQEWAETWRHDHGMRT
ncbi:MAG: tetratricopeptide repeat protein [Gammaproteobacteria bacterium]|nr:tetratricopeptide repeat protein [Gammaproteobacteria bacterium]